MSALCKRILAVSPTEMELAAVRQAGVWAGMEVDFAVTGVGVLPTCFCLTELLTRREYEWVLCFGIAGAFPDSAEVGEVLAVHTEYLDDLECGSISGLYGAFDKGLISPNDHPFSNGALRCPYAAGIAAEMGWRAAGSVTVSLLVRTPRQLRLRREYYTNTDIENMEGGAFFYVCLLKRVKFLQIRSISNIVGSPIRQWNFPLALEGLTRAAEGIALRVC